MNRLKEKLRSNEGASLILALLVFLLCIMVAASVLAAAVSNAGKARSSRVEQQRYQTLSSAVRLICGELEKVEYKGRYRFFTWTDGSIEYFCYEQLKSGKIEMQDSYASQTFQLAEFDFMKEGALNKEMDEVFRRQFQNTGGSPKDGYKPLPDDDVTSTAVPIRLTVTLPDNLPGYPGGSTPFGEYKISKKAQIKIELDHNDGNSAGNIKLTAWLSDDDTSNSPSDGSGVMIAVLKPVWTPESLNPDSGLGGSIDNIPEGVTPTEVGGEVSVTWKLDRISMTAAP